MKLKADSSACVRYSSKLSECKECENICPYDAIKCVDGGISLFLQNCTSCGVCVGICPTEALELGNFSVRDFLFDFLKSDENRIGCRYNFRCLSTFNVEYLVSLALMKDIVLDLGHCGECPLDEGIKRRIKDLVDEANFILSKISNKKIEIKDLCLEKTNDSGNRREIFSIFDPKSMEKLAEDKKNELERLKDPFVKIEDDLAYKKREKIIPDKRKIFYSVLKRVKRPESFEKIESKKISFVSSKEIDDSCDNCSICYRVCPSGALSSSKRGDVIFFDDMLCLKCHLCHDVCEKDSIKIGEFFDTKEFFEPRQRVLKRFEVVRCDECGNLFTYFGEEKICQRCKIEEEEAKGLWGM